MYSISVWKTILSGNCFSGLSEPCACSVVSVLRWLFLCACQTFCSSLAFLDLLWVFVWLLCHCHPYLLLFLYLCCLFLLSVHLKACVIFFFSVGRIKKNWNVLSSAKPQMDTWADLVLEILGRVLKPAQYGHILLGSIITGLEFNYMSPYNLELVSLAWF